MHDAFGKPLSIGDRVMVPCTVKAVTTSDEYCNLTLETEASMPPYTDRNSITLNAKQVLRNSEPGDALDYAVFHPDGGPRSLLPAPQLPVVVTHNDDEHRG